MMICATMYTNRNTLFLIRLALSPPFVSCVHIVLGTAALILLGKNYLSTFYQLSQVKRTFKNGIINICLQIIIFSDGPNL
jgi:hypothetical protein